MPGADMRARERLVRADDQLLRLGDGTDALGQRLCVLGAVTVRDGNALQLRVHGTRFIARGQIRNGAGAAAHFFAGDDVALLIAAEDGLEIQHPCRPVRRLPAHGPCGAGTSGR